MRLTARQLNRATLERQLLAQRHDIGVEEAMGRIFALQAQEPASPYLALWARVAGFRPSQLDAAISERTVVKASLMRLTLHAVRADAYPAMHAAMVSSLRASRLHDRRFKSTGLTIAQVDSLLPELLDFAASPRTQGEIQDWLDARLGALGRPAWWAIRTFAPLWHLPTGGPWAFGPRKSFVAAADGQTPVDQADGAAQLLRGYLAAFGPATPSDFAQCTLFTRAAARETLERLAHEVVRSEGPDGRELYDLREAPPIPAEDSPAPPRLLPMWDSVLLAYADRSRVIPPEFRGLVIKQNGDVLPTLLVDGYVAGIWRAVDGVIEAKAFAPLPEDAWAGLAEEAATLSALLNARDASVYRRHARWWDRTPGVHVRRLGASSEARSLERSSELAHLHDEEQPERDGDDDANHERQP